MKDAPSPSSPSPLPSTELRASDVCQRFDAALKAGPAPIIEAYLGGAAGAERVALLKELVRLEVSHRRRRGESIQSAEYLRRFPELDPAAPARQPLPETLSKEPTVLAETLPTARPPSAAPATGAAPFLVPGYEVQGELGRGGMGVVYLARNVLMDRREVLKVVKKALLDESGVAERFLREIRAAALLNHNNVVKAYSAVQVGESIVLAMEYVEGEDLARVVQRQGPLPIAHACHYVAQAAMGLQHAHDQQLVHRDIKPQNLILSRQPKKHVVKVLDFGLAKAKRERDAVTALTGQGAMMGTPEYMAPEQAQDAACADIRADIYSLGCTLYFLLTGAPPFTGKSAFAILQAHVSAEAAPLGQLRPDAPAGLAAVVAKMMAKDPARRYQKPIDAAQALVPFIKAGSAPKPESKKHRSAVSLVDGTAANVEGVPNLPETLPVRSAAERAEAKSRSAPHLAAPPPADPAADEVVWTEVNGVMQAAAPGPADVRDTSAAGAVSAGKSVMRPAARKGLKKAPIVAAFGLLLLLVVGIGSWVGGLFGVGPPAKRGDSPPLENPPLAQTSDPAPPAGPKGDPPLVVAPFDPAEARQTQAECARRLGVSVVKEVDLGGGVVMKLVLIPPGEFQMGALDSDDTDLKDATPRHLVRITKPFYLGMVPVTQEQYERVKGKNPSKFCKEGEWKDEVAGLDTARFPVENVSWNDANAFCEDVNQMASLKSAAWRYDLPTEAEWEYACRAGTTTAYFFGDAAADLGDYAWFKANSGGRTQEVGTRKPNPWGLYDMNGNVWQWCADCYTPSYYRNSPLDDPKNLDDRGARVNRGGSWYYGSDRCRAAYRCYFTPKAEEGEYGFRVCIRPE